MSFEEVFLGFLVALAAGALIGLEREQSMAADHKHRLGGVRTFPLIALAGALSALLSHRAGVWPILVSLLVIGAFMAVSLQQDGGQGAARGITTEAAALITFLLGVLALYPDLPLARGQRYLLIVASASVVMALLSFKEPLHEAVRRVSMDDLYATAKFVILALVILPLLPDQTYDPLDAFNPFHTGLIIVLVAGISFVGYFATRIAGEAKGLTVTGLVGGFVSSTAVTVSMATRACVSPRLLPFAAMAILLASGTMFVRMLVVVGIVDPGLVPYLLGPLGAMAAVSYATAAALYRSSRGHVAGTETVPHRNPFELRSAVQFGLLYLVILFASKAAHTTLGNPGLYLSSVLAGTTDVDAISVVVARFHLEGLPDVAATLAVSLAAMTNTAVKVGIAAWLGGRDLVVRIAPGIGSVVAVGGLALFLLR